MGGVESVGLQQGTWALQGPVVGLLASLLQMRWEGGVRITLSGLHLQLRTPPPKEPGGSSGGSSSSSSSNTGSSSSSSSGGTSGSGSSSGTAREGSGSGVGGEGAQAGRAKKRRRGGPVRELALPAWIVNALPGFGIRIEGVKVTHAQVCALSHMSESSNLNALALDALSANFGELALNVQLSELQPLLLPLVTLLPPLQLHPPCHQQHSPNLQPREAARPARVYLLCSRPTLTAAAPRSKDLHAATAIGGSHATAGAFRHGRGGRSLFTA
ncbi:MAG: hypothetical protein WDW36_007297 [Sanguina aurantia]